MSNLSHPANHLILYQASISDFLKPQFIAFPGSNLNLPLSRFNLPGVVPELTTVSIKCFYLISCDMK